MIAYLFRRVLGSIPVFFGVSLLSFALIHFVPGDPVEMMLGEQASQTDKETLRHQLGLDRPLVEQFKSYYVGLLHFDLGKSLTSKRPVAFEIGQRFGASLELASTALFFAIVIGIPLGVCAAVFRRRWPEKLVLGYGLVAMSTPSIWIGPMLILIFAIQLDLLPVSDRGGFEHTLLPAMTLALGLSAVLSQVTRAAMLEVIREEYVTVAKAKGASPLRLWFKHALANAMIPIITVVGLQLGAILTGTVIVETIFDWPGLGTLLFQAIQNRNYPVVQGCVLLISATYVFVNLLTDLLYAVANPKMRLS